MRIGLTGGIASGKTTVSRRLAELGAAVLDADAFARIAVEKGSEGLKEIVKAFGGGMLDSDGCLDRRKLGAAVFGVFPTEEAARGAAEALKAQWPQVYVARPDRGGARVISPKWML